MLSDARPTQPRNWASGTYSGGEIRDTPSLPRALWTLKGKGRNWTYWNFSCSLVVWYLTTVVKRSSNNFSHHPEGRPWASHHLLKKDTSRSVRPVATNLAEELPWNFRSGVWAPEKCTVSSMFSDRMPFFRHSAMREHILNMLLYWLFS